MIKIQDVNFTRNEQQILQHIDFHMQRDEQWVILGKNGSGKTTLLELIAGYQFPSKGSVEVAGYKYSQCDIREVRKKIGYISQTLLEKLTLRDPVHEIVATGELGYLRFYEPIPDRTLEKAHHMLELVQLPQLSNQPLGSLSQGERKKVMLARALMSDPSILIMDEPCSGLDLYEREKLLQSIESLRDQQINMIYVTHHIEEIVPFFTHVLLLDNGKIVAKGKKEDVVTEAQLRSAFQVPIRLNWQQGRPWIQVDDFL